MPRKSEQVANKRGDEQVVAAMLAWFRLHARKLPWRDSGEPGQRDPYLTLVSELMLQQTQVARVLEKFEPFLKRFPTVRALATAPEEDVLAAWSGLGYYRRARLLQAAARGVVEEFGGTFPVAAADLRRLPGVGRYTAGAIASLACGGHEALVDGNVTRVLLRISARPGKVADKATDAWAWSRAEELLASVPRREAGRWNEALMELGATVCTPMAPRCTECPVSRLCQARARGLSESIPAPKTATARKKVHWECLVAIDRAGRVLLRRRGTGGLFAGLEEVPTIESAKPATAQEIAEMAENCGVKRPVFKGQERFLLTHRELIVRVWRGFHAGGAGNGRWVAAADLHAAGLPNVQRAVLRLAGIGPEIRD